MLPVGPASHRRTPCIPRVRPIAFAGGELTERAAPHPEGDRSEVIAAADDLPEAEGETQDRRVWVADEWEAAGPREEVS